ncbi:MAG: hypothetical protein K5866_06285 [Treponema sp.]|nr:hypothetical protein [Treponema sp.]
MEYAHLFEAFMLICFGFSWPLNVIKAYKARTAKGTSLAFIILIVTGYLAGITAKIINGQFNYVLAVYFINLAIVMLNIFVYIRNKALDRKAKVNKTLKVENIKVEPEEENMNYTNSLDKYINRKDESVEMKNSVILMGSSMDKKIPVAELGQSFAFNFKIYNHSDEKLSLTNAEDYFNQNIAGLAPEGILLHLGDNDVKLFSSNTSGFDSYYLNLINEIKSVNKNCRIALISVNNPENDKTIVTMNAHIKAIAQAANVDFVNIENAKLWNPKATKAAADFAYGMGLKIRKPLRDVAEILYSWAYNELSDEKASQALVG